MRNLGATVNLGAIVITLIAMGCESPASHSQDQIARRHNHSDASEQAFPGEAGRLESGRLYADVAREPPMVWYEVVRDMRVLEGDILLDDAVVVPHEPGTAQQGLAAVSHEQRLWPDGVVPYEIEPSMPAAADARDALAHVGSATSLTFVERTSEVDFVRFVDGAGCSSYVGRIGGEQPITLSDKCGFGAGVHEILHAVGVWHEQQRTDRDAHVVVRFDNIEEGFEGNFEKYLEPEGNAFTSYDLGSIMHYGSYAFSKNGQPTIVLAGNQQTYTHNRQQLSAHDVEGVQALYAEQACGCSADKTCTVKGACVYFLDVPVGSTHAANIDTIFEHGITVGCGTRRYCPSEAVTREQMATFLTRALGLTPRHGTHFTDVAADSSHAKNIYAIYDAGITHGCGTTTYCPSEDVTRAQMASFLVRALNLPPSTDKRFSDTAGNTHEADINALAAAGITQGCSPTAYCPADPVTREQMATFLVRALEL